MNVRIVKLGALIGLAATIGGCTTLGGNVKGDFACRAPDGTCAPTSIIDEQATGTSRAQSAVAHGGSAMRAASLQTNGRRLRVVVAAYRDASGREHEARVVHVPLAEKPASRWRSPLSTGDVLRALGRASQAHTNPVIPDKEATATPHQSTSPQQLPDILVIPSRDAPQLPGASAPDTGASGRSPSPGRVPHPVTPEGESR